MGNENRYLMVRVSNILKKDFKKFCKIKGLTVSEAVRIFVHYCLENGTTPYNIADRDKYNEDDNSTRISITMDSELRQKFAEACGKYNLSMSLFLRDFMNECVVKNKFPFDKK